MSDLRIVGMVMLAVIILSCTGLIMQQINLAAKERRAWREEQLRRAETRDARFHDMHEALWMEEKTKRIAAEQEVANLKKEIERMESLMGKIKISKIKEYR